MKASNIFTLCLMATMLGSLVYFNNILAAEYEKIDLDDKYKNYATIETKPFHILHLSGSNGYPIRIQKSTTQSVKVLRSRRQHFESHQLDDTLFIRFTGANIPMDQSFQNQTPPGIIIAASDLTDIIAHNTFNKISEFDQKSMNILLYETSTADISNCTLDRIHLTAQGRSQYSFSQKNSIDSLSLIMEGSTIGRLDDISFSNIQHSLGDSVVMVLSNKVFARLDR